MPEWTELELPTPMAAAAAERRGVPLPRDFVTEFDTENPTQREAFSILLFDPLPCLSGEWPEDDFAGHDADDAVAAELHRLRIDGVDNSWKVVTVLRNHHRRLNPRINTFRVTVNYEEETVYGSVDKQLDESTPPGGR